MQNENLQNIHVATDLSVTRLNTLIENLKKELSMPGDQRSTAASDSQLSAVIGSIENARDQMKQNGEPSSFAKTLATAAEATSNWSQQSPLSQEVIACATSAAELEREYYVAPNDSMHSAPKAWPKAVRYPLIAVFVVVVIFGLVSAFRGNVHGAVIRIVVVTVIVIGLLGPIQAKQVSKRQKSSK